VLKYGGDYNPEQWPESVWPDDIRLMKQAGVNFVTVGVFSWALLEPEPGRFEFGWLDRVLDLLHESGIAVDLATATASPPPWLSARHPEILPVSEDGVTMSPGSRQHYAPSSPVYREHAARMTRAMAERYGTHPAVVMWHINNEYGCHTNLDYSAAAEVAFRGWLREKYGDVAGLNESWGTAFWSQHYSSFDQVLPPRVAPTWRNPGQLLDFRRFSSDALLECFLAEKAILREVAPHIPVTTNFIGAFKPLDYWKWAPHLDVIADDSYPDPLDPRSPMAAAMSRDLMRSLGGGAPWLLMEQATGHVQWRPTNGSKPGSTMQALSLQAVARGADGICFFQWRQSSSGAEMFHSAMVPHTGEHSRVFRRVVDLGTDLAALAAVEGGRVDARVAIVLDWENWWAIESGAKPQSLDHLGALESWYGALYGRNVMVDFVHPSQSLERYALVIAPQLYLLAEANGRNLADYVDGGGTLVTTYFSGIVDEREHAYLGGYLGPLRSTLGVVIDEFDPIPLTGASASLAVEGDGIAFTGTVWSEYLEPRGAEVLARFTDGHVAGSPALTRHRVGSGEAWYVATQPDAAGIAALIDLLLDRTGVRPVVAGLPAGVEAVRRGDLLFLINLGDETVDSGVAGADLISGTVSDSHVLDAGQTVAISVPEEGAPTSA
jgi:beta-galactosidase